MVFLRCAHFTGCYCDPYPSILCCEWMNERMNAYFVTWSMLSKIDKAHIYKHYAIVSATIVGILQGPYPSGIGDLATVVRTSRTVEAGWRDWHIVTSSIPSLPDLTFEMRADRLLSISIGSTYSPTICLHCHLVRIWFPSRSICLCRHVLSCLRLMCPYLLVIYERDSPEDRTGPDHLSGQFHHKQI